MDSAKADAIGQMSAAQFKRKYSQTSSAVIRTVINIPVVAALDAFIQTANEPTQAQFESSICKSFIKALEPLRQVLQHFRISRLFLLHWYQSVYHRLRRQFEQRPRVWQAFSRAWWKHVLAHLVRAGASGVIHHVDYRIQSRAGTLARLGCNMTHLFLLEHPIYVRLATSMLLQHLQMQLAIMGACDGVSYSIWCENVRTYYSNPDSERAVTVALYALYFVLSRMLSQVVGTLAPAYVAARYPRWAKHPPRLPRLRLKPNQTQWSVCQVADLMAKLIACLDDGTAVIMENEVLGAEHGDIEEMDLDSMDEWPYMHQRLGEIMYTHVFCL
jgi:hypothetical protein